MYYMQQSKHKKMKHTKSIKSILLMALATALISFAACSCNRGNTPAIGNGEQEFKTNCRIELSDGRVLEGTEIRIGGNNQYHIDRNEMMISVKGLGGDERNAISASVILDEHKNLLPFGAENGSGGYYNGMTVLLKNTNESFTTIPFRPSQSVVDSHSMSNLKLHPYRVPGSGIEFPTFRYEFNGVVLRNVIGGAEEVTANGYILCEPI